MKNDFPKIGAPATRALTSIGVTQLFSLTKFTEKEIMSLHGMGTKAMKLIRQALTEKGLSLKS